MRSKVQRLRLVVSMASEKKYGLIIPARKKAGAAAGKPIAKPSVFGDSSSDEEDSGGKKGFKSSLWKENKKRAKQIESHEAVVKALAEDPSVFEYDNIYDDLQEKKKKSDPRLQKKDTRPKYIYNLKKTAERRKLEQDIIYERKVQRDMEKEGKEYGDKETFLTSAYRKKLEERRKMEEELKQEEIKEAANDVTKQKDLSKFHRHLLNRLDHGAVEEKPREEDIPKLQRRTSGERSSHSERERERERDKERRRRSEDGHEEQRERRRSGEERRRSRNYSDMSNGEENPAIPKTIENEDGEQQMQEEKAETEGIEEERGEERAIESEQSFVEEEAPKLPSEMTQEDKEERRKIAATKRTDSQAQLSAKERYLARKRARTSAPLITKDD